MDVQAAIFDRAKTYCRSPADLAHLHESTECARRICEREGGDLRVVLPAIMLHDIGWSAFTADEEFEARGSSIEAKTANRRHEEEGAALARPILEEYGYDPSLIDQITEIIRRHEGKSAPRSLEDAIVRDANMLARFTRDGFESTCARFRLNEAEGLALLQGSVDKWFLTKAGRLSARLHLSKRRLRSIQATAKSGGIIDRMLEIFLEAGDRVLVKAQKSLEEIAIQELRQRLADIKRQLEIYLRCHPGATIADLQRDAELQSLAVQRIFTDGYTGIIDICKSSPTYGRIIFHPDARVINQPMEWLRKERPSDVTHSFWDWYMRALEGEEFSAYYGSKDRADATREKVQCVAPVRVGALEWSLVVSAFVDQSFRHADALAAEIASSIDVMLDELDANMLYPLARLIEGSEVIAKGDLSHRIQVDVDNELASLAAAFNKMIQSIQSSSQQMQDHARLLARQRDDLQSSIQIIEQQQASIAELSVPVIRIWKHVLVLPLVGVIDEARGQRIIETILPRVVAERARHVFLDLTGVSLAGPEIVDTLARITGAIGLLGAACTLTGISPAVASALVQTNVALHGARTAMNLEQGLRQILGSSVER